MKLALTLPAIENACMPNSPVITPAVTKEFAHINIVYLVLRFVPIRLPVVFAGYQGECSSFFVSIKTLIHEICLISVTQGDLHASVKSRRCNIFRKRPVIRILCVTGAVQSSCQLRSEMEAQDKRDYG